MASKSATSSESAQGSTTDHDKEVMKFDYYSIPK
jgi:hypothetical protein